MSVMSQNDGKMEGWLYLMRLNRLGMQYSRKMYFILHGNFLRSFKSEGTSEIQEPLRRAIIDCCIRVTDNGKETVSRKVFFSFTLYNSSNLSDQLKLGASSPEEAAKWIRALQEAALKELSNPAKNFAACSSGSPLRLVGSRSPLRSSVDWTFCSLANTEAMTNDVIAPSPWKIFGSQNGLRLFKEAKDWDSRGRQWDDHPAIMAVGVVDGTSEAIFRTLLCLGPSRSDRWDFCIFRGTVVENIDGHTDIIHQQLYSDWLPWGMKRRDLLLRRYWRREEDGTYVILYHSVSHKKCPPKRGYVRACLKSGGYVISPVNRGKQSLVRHMLAIDWKFWKFWKLYLHPSSARSITIRMLERIAALRELHGTRAGNCSREFVSEELSRYIGIAHSGNEITKTESNSMEETKRVEEVNLMEDDAEKPDRASLKGMHESVDEFFDVPEPTDYDQFENEWPSEFIEEKTPTNTHQPRMSNSSRLVKKIHQLRAQKKGCMDLPEVAKEDCMSCSHGSTLQKDPNCATPSSWGAADPSSFLIRGPNYLRDNQKIKAKGSLMQLVGVDWLRCDERIDNLSSRFGGIVQKYADRGGPEFFFVVNIQIPGTTMSTLAFYYMLNTPLDENPLLHSFVNGDDAYRNSRFKLIPYISQGSWIVKQSVGKKACLVGQALEVHYFRGKNYYELMIDVGSSMVARGVSNLVLGYLNNLVIEIAFLIQANTEEELPEVLLGTCRLNHLDASKAVQVKS